MFGTGVDVVPIPVLSDVPTGTGGTSIDVVLNLPMCTIPVLMPYRISRGVRYRYLCRTELDEVFGTGIDVLPNLPMWC